MNQSLRWVSALSVIKIYELSSDCSDASHISFPNKRTTLSWIVLLFLSDVENMLWTIFIREIEGSCMITLGWYHALSCASWVKKCTLQNDIASEDYMNNVKTRSSYFNAPLVSFFRATKTLFGYTNLDHENASKSWSRHRIGVKTRQLRKNAHRGCICVDSGLQVVVKSS